MLQKLRMEVAAAGGLPRLSRNQSGRARRRVRQAAGALHFRSRSHCEAHTGSRDEIASQCRLT